VEAAANERPLGVSGIDIGNGVALSTIVWRGRALIWAPDPIEGDGTSSSVLTDAEVRSRTRIPDLMERLRRLPGFDGAVLERTGTQVGVRETRRVVGEYMLTEEDVLNGARFDDSIAIGANPMACLEKRPILEHDGFEIPYGCLLPIELDGILLAGRCISVTHEAHGSTRAMATCMATGQASGIAAALATEMGEIPRYVSVPKLQERLMEDGAMVKRPT
jgi:hypothetical protein